jgi:hypothetical protein
MMMMVVVGAGARVCRGSPESSDNKHLFVRRPQLLATKAHARVGFGTNTRLLKAKVAGNANGGAKCSSTTHETADHISRGNSQAPAQAELCSFASD